MVNRIVRNLRSGEEKKHLEMLNLCYGFWGDEEKYKRFYSQEGFEVTNIVLIVEEAGKWIGGATVWFLEAFLKEERKVKVCISGDAYVHPEYRRQGVYSTCVRPACARAMRAQEKGASLGTSFTSIYNTPRARLQKHGFIDMFYPATKILVLHPQRYFDFLIKQLKDVEFPEKLEGKTVELTVFLKSFKGQDKVSEVFQVKNKKLEKVTASNLTRKLAQKVDLQISADIETLEKTLRRFHLRKKSRFPLLFVDIMRRRLKLRFSARMLKAILGFVS